MNELERLCKERDKLLEHIRLDARRAATNRNIFPYQDSFASQEYLDLMAEPNRQLGDILRQIYIILNSQSGPRHFSKDNVFVWGGPTPSWGGSMDKDASIVAKDYFGFDNVMYVYGPHSDEMFEIHKDCRKLICHLGRNCRTEGAQTMSDVEEAEHLGDMSLKYPNIIGGVVDDMIGNCGTRYSRDTYIAMHDALKDKNPNLDVYGVVYTRELYDPFNLTKLEIIRNAIDHVILWTWDKSHIMDLDMNLERCRSLFPGKPVMMGVFMFDYGLTCLPADAPSIQFQLEKSRQYLAQGKIQDIVILGDREIHKCPEIAVLVKNFFKNEFAQQP